MHQEPTSDFVRDTSAIKIIAQIKELQRRVDKMIDTCDQIKKVLK